MSIENPTLSAAADLAHFRHFSSLFTNLSSTTVEIALQIHSFMQNKPKVKYAKINVSSFVTSKYELLDTWLMGKTKPKQTQLKPIQTQFKPIKANFNAKQSQFKPNCFKPISAPNESRIACLGCQCGAYGEFYLRWKNIMLASAVESHIIAVRNILNCNGRVAKPWSKITLCNPESASRPTFRIISLVLPVLSKESFMHGDSDESLCLSKFEYCIF